MKAPVLIVSLVLSALSIGSAAVLLFDAKPGSAKPAKATTTELPDFRWGEGTEASVMPAKAIDER